MKVSKQEQPQPQKAWSIPQLAGVLGVSRATVFRWYQAGHIKGVRLTPRGNIRIPYAEVERFLEQQGAGL